MAKQNLIQSFAQNMRQNKKKEDADNKTAKDKKGIWILILVVEIVLIIIFMVILISWSDRVGKSSVLFDFIAEQMLSTTSIIVDLIIGLVAVIQIIRRKRKYVYITVYIALVFLIIGLIASTLKVFGAVKKDKEEETGKKTEEVEKNGVNHSVESSMPVYQLRRYVQEEDPFVLYLEQYCGVSENSIPQEDKPREIADLIKRTVQDAAPESLAVSIPKTYEDDVLTADVLYREYLSMKKEAKNQASATVKANLQKECLRILTNALGYRTDADEAYKTSENRRLIALYYVDMGDEYKSTDNIKDAADCYELAAEWSTKAMFLAVVANKRDMVEKAWEIIDNVVSRMEPLEEIIGEARYLKIKNCRDAYRLIIDEWN